MPLRSVEAATRDDAIAAAREQFGPAARVVGVRRVRSGGVLGFFATERYVAEVDPDHPSRTAGRERAAARSSAVQAAEEATAGRRAETASAQAPSRAAADRVSELAGLLGHDAGPAADDVLPTYSRAAVARPSAAREFLAHEPARDDAPPRGFRAEPSDRVPSGWEPARTGSTRWEPARWEPARTETPWPEPEPLRPAPEAFDWGRFEAARAGARPASPPVAAEPGSLRIRAGAAEPAPAPWSIAAALLDSEQGGVRDGRDDDAPSTGASLPPSPFTAALARMVAGDQDVRKAVQAALDDRAAGGSGRDDAEPPRPRSTAPVATPAKTGAGHQEEEPVEQDDVSPSLRTEVRPAEFPTWAEPEPAAEPVSRREEAIAEVLRAALAQGHSDEALTAILRKVLDGASPQAALTAETMAAAPRVEPRPLAAEITELPAVEVTLADLPDALDEAPVAEAPAMPPVVDEEPLTYTPSAGYAAVEIPEPAGPAIAERAPVTTSTPSWLGSGLPLWGEPVDGAQLWGGTTATTGYPDVRADEPIWAEVVLHEPAAAVAEPVAEWLPIAEPVAEEFHAEALHAEELHIEEPAVEEPVAQELHVEELHVEEPPVEELVADAAVDDAPVADAPVADFALAESPAFEPAPPVESPVVDAAPEENTVAEAPAAEPAAAEPAAAEATPVEECHTAAEPLTATLARTASDPAPLPLDATAVMPPLSLLPPLPSSGRRGGGLPPVPPMPSRSLLSPSRPLAGRPAADVRTEAEPAPAPAPVKTLATVTRLPVAPLADLLDDAIEDVIDDPAEIAEEEPSMGEYQVAETTEVAVPAAALGEPAAPAVPATPWAAEPAPTVAVPVSTPVPAAPAQPAGLAGRLVSLGIPDWLLGPTFTADVALHGTYAALTRALGAGLPAAPVVPDGPGEVLFVVGPGVETLRAARSLAAWLRLDPDRVQWATRGDLAGLAPEYSRVTTIETAIERRQDATLAGTVTIVAVDAPLRTDAYWTSQMLAIWAPEAVWAVVDATRKPEDVEPWIDGLPRVDALMVEDTDLSADPAAVLHRIAMPVALLDGVPATPHRWASLLCERLEQQQG